MPTYVRLQDTFPEHPKIHDLSDGAFRLYVTALCYAARTLTDGRVPRSMLKRLGGTVPRAAELFDAKLWECPKDYDGWEIHDYLKHQRSRARVEEISAARSAAGEKGVLAKRKQIAEQNKNGWSTHKQKQIAETETKADRRSANGLTSRQWYQRAYGKPPNAKDRAEVDGVHDSHPQSCIDAVWERALEPEIEHKWPWARAVFEHGEEHEPKEDEPVRLAR